MTAKAPQAIEAEQAVLGGVLCSPPMWPHVSDLLSAEDFARKDHGAIWSAIKSLADKGEAFDALTVADVLVSKGMGELIQDGAYLVDLASGVFTLSNVQAYAGIVTEKATLRALMAHGRRAVDLAVNHQGRDTAEILSELNRELSTLANSRPMIGARSLHEVAGAWVDQLQAMYSSPETAHGLLTPWSQLNRLTNGFYPGDLVIAAGRPGMGKSAMAINLAMSASLRAQRGMYFSLEMTDVSLFSRMVATLSDVPLAWFRKPDLSTEAPSYWPRISNAIAQLQSAPLIIDESAGLTMDAIVARAKREHMRSPLSFVVIDHLHLIKLPKRENGATEYGDVTHAAKTLAKTLRCPVVLLAQLNRGVEARNDKRPALSDLRDSGAIEQDADTVVLLYRPEYYARQTDAQSDADTDDALEFIVAKQREGSTGTAYARAELSLGRIVDFPDGYVRRSAEHRTDRTNVRGFGKTVFGARGK